MGIYVYILFLSYIDAMHLKSPTSSRIVRAADSLGHYEIEISIILGYFVFFNITDLLSTSVALGRGLVESNVALVSLAHFLGVSIVVAMGLTKIGFIWGACFLGILGVRTKNKWIRSLAFWSIVIFVVLFSLISCSNLLVLLTRS